MFSIEQEKTINKNTKRIHMKLHKVALWKKRIMYYILDSNLVLNMVGIDIGLRISFLDSEEKLNDRMKQCNLVQKQ